MTSVNLNLKSYVLPVIDKEIDLVLNSSFDYDMSSFTAQPLCSLGYTYFFHQSYDNLNKALNKVGSKRETHWIVNNFEPILTEVEKKNELLNGLKKYFDKAKLSDDKLVEPLFLQMWEILMCHNLLAEKTNKINIVSKKLASLNEDLKKYKFYCEMALYICNLVEHLVTENRFDKKKIVITIIPSIFNLNLKEANLIKQS